MKLSKFDVILLTMSLFGTLIFFGFVTLTGRVYGGASSDGSYISFMMIVDIIPLILFVKFLRVGANKKNVLPIILVLITLIIVYGFGLGTDNMTFKSLMSFSVPAALIGILIAKSNQGPYFAKLLEPAMLFFTIVGMASMRLLLSVDSLRDVGELGVGTQSLAYHCGFAFALNLYFLLFGDELPERFKYAKTSIYKFLSILLLIVQFATGLSSGGRGGFLLLLFSGMVMILLRFTRRSGNSRRTSFTFLLLSAVILVAAQFIPENIVEAMSRGSERTFSYITNSGDIDMSETSNRNYVYEDCWKSIAESPIIGHGLLMKGTPFYGDRPHNIFFEILLQGGVIYLIVFLLFVSRLSKKMRLLIKRGHGLYMIPIALYPAVMLLFSGSYIESNIFWFVISYILCCDIPKKQHNDGAFIKRTVQTL